jgi:hypothetical protein
MNTLPKAYANMIGWSDITPFEIVKTSPSGKQLTLRAMNYKLNPDWKPEFHAGGFAANCSNLNEQKWIIESNEQGLILKANKRADGYYWSAYGKHRIEAAPRRFYDYNF